MTKTQVNGECIKKRFSGNTMLNAMNSVVTGEITADTNLSYIKRNIDKEMTD